LDKIINKGTKLKTNPVQGDNNMTYDSIRIWDTALTSI